MNTINKSLNESLELFEKLGELAPDIEEAGSLILKKISGGGKLILLGNGGSAADAQHIAAEMVGRFEYDHIPIPAVALTTNTSILTAVSNDFGFDEIFLRQMKSLMRKEDVVLGISTSGSSGNIIKAIEYALEHEVPVIGLTGKDGGEMKELCKPCIIVPSERTCRIQEAHILIGHILCEIIEKKWMRIG
ncbi:MAG: D-sedoheptulose 7-phosphate isomerase [Candidatus Eremiobacteraeota bacterium]|nr:D-sedoheptulose 7-phosphate isomerase [Candidatus Eremiobacteraeota bacterium]